MAPQHVGMNVDGIREVMQALCEMDDHIVEAEAAAFRPGVDPQRAVAIRTHAHHAARMARSILLIDGHFAGAEIVPNVRLLFECAVTAAWLLLHPGSGHTLLRDGAQQRRKALTTLREIGEDTEQASARAEKSLADLAKAEGPRSFVFEQRCRSLQEGVQLYSLYRILSSDSHAGVGIADLYLEMNDDSPIGLSFTPYASRDNRESTLGIAACMLLLALNADELASAEPRFAAEISKIARRLGVSGRITRVDGFEMPART